MNKKSVPAIAGIGIDITEVARIRKIFGKHPASLKRFFTPEETRYCLKSRNKYERIAARFAAKEAVIKALDMTSLPLKAISVTKAETGRPCVVLSGARFKNTRIMLSLTHTADYACAVAIVLRKG